MDQSEFDRQNAMPGPKPGSSDDHPGWDLQTGTCDNHPDGCKDSMDPNRPNRPAFGGTGKPGFFGRRKGKGTQPQSASQGGSWGRGQGFGR